MTIQSELFGAFATLIFTLNFEIMKKVSYKQAIREAIAIRADFSDGKILAWEFKAMFSRLSEASGISYSELIAESAE